MRKTTVALAVAALLATLSKTALASGFYLPWWGEALFFLLVTPAGWACLALVAAALIGLAVYAVKRGQGK